MNLRQLTVFCTVCEEMSFTKAARRLYMTQPAVSHVVAELEEETGCVLFDRISRRIDLTGAGRAFYEKAARIVELHEDLEKSAGALEFASPVRIGSSITIANFLLPGMMRRFSEAFPGIPARVEVDTARHNTEKLLENAIDVALIEGVISDNRLAAHPFSSFDIVAVRAPGYPLPASLTPQSLVRETLLLREQGSSVRDVLDSALMLHGLAAEPVWTSVDSQTLIRAAKSGLGISILPEILVRDELASGALVRVGVRGLHLKNNNYTVYRRDKYLSPALRGFLKIAEDRRLEESENKAK